MKNAIHIANNKIALLAVVGIAAGVLAGLYLVQRPVDIRNRAAEPDRCQMPIMTCSVDPGEPGTYDDFILQIIDPLDPGTPILEGAANQSQIEAPVQPDKIYECHIKSLTDSQCWRKVQGVSPVCLAPSITPTSIIETPTVPVVTPTGFVVTPTLPVVTPTGFVVTPTPTLFPGCPIGLKSIEPILCVINEQGQCY